MAPHLPTRLVGIRPGEKLHEVMCPADDAHQTLEFPDHYVIKPSIPLFSNHDYRKNVLNETGVPVADNFEYSSNVNDWWLEGEPLLKMVNSTQLDV
jgi:UDP-N-acetylglucosamine 4,6-dehydratase